MQNVPLAASRSQISMDRISSLWHRKGMVIASINVNSLLLNIDEIHILVKELWIHILALSETELGKSIADSLVKIEGYTIKR